MLATIARRTAWAIIALLTLLSGYALLHRAFDIPGVITLPVTSTEGAQRSVFTLPSSHAWRAEPVSINTARGVLHGIFMPADPGAPLVVHYQASRQAVTLTDSRALLRQLRMAGFASLMIDYTGAGASTGEATPRSIPDDALATWNEALERTGGDPQRIVLRGTSLGALAVASLLERGVEPGGVILIAPVRAETIIENWATTFHAAPVAFLATPWLEDIGEMNLVSALAETDAPTVVITSPIDVLLPADERSLVREAVEARGSQLVEIGVDDLPAPLNPWASTWVRTRLGDVDLGHFDLGMAARQLLDPEHLVLRAVLPTGPPIEQRVARWLATQDADIEAHFRPASPAREELESILTTERLEPDPVRIASLLAHNADPLRARALSELRAERYPHWLTDVPLRAAAMTLSLDDPAGPIDAELVSTWLAELWGHSTGGSWDTRIATGWDLATLRSAAAAIAPDDFQAPSAPVLIEVEEHVFDAVTLEPKAVSRSFERQIRAGRLWVELAGRRGLTVDDARRQTVRVLLKAAGIPERIVPHDDGSIVLEVWQLGAWHPTDLEPLAHLDERAAELARHVARTEDTIAATLLEETASPRAPGRFRRGN